MQRFIFSSLFAVALGCGDPTSILVEVTSTELRAPEDVDTLRFLVDTGAGHRLDRTYRIDGDWPHSLAVLPATSDEAVVTVIVEGIRGGRPVIRRVARTAFVSGSQRIVEVTLSRDCLNVICGEEVDCVAGRCVGMPSDAGVDGGSLDGGLDAGVDGGRRDAGPGDAGRGDAGPGDAGSDAGDVARLPLLITEYVEGTSNNKAIEIQNTSSAPVDLSRCEIQRFANGTTTPTPIALSGTLAGGAVHVLCNTSIAVATACDQSSGALSHNGDDALALACDGVTIDVFGTIGPPVAVWSGGGLSSQDFILFRQCSVASGDPNGADMFDPSIQWMGRAWDGAAPAAVNLAGLGNRTECP